MLGERKKFTQQRLRRVWRAAARTRYVRGIERGLSVSGGLCFLVLLPIGTEDGTVLYEIVGTNLWNLKMPFIRYRSGDLIRLPEGLSEQQLEAICYGVEPFSGVLGRQGDYLVSPDGAHLMGIDHIPRDVEHVVRLQVIQETLHRVRILVVPTEGFGERDRQQVLRNASLKLPSEMRVEVEVV